MLLYSLSLSLTPLPPSLPPSLPQNCHLGQHEPLVKGLGEEGIVFSDSTEEGMTDDPHTDTRHGLPAGLSAMCSNVLGEEHRLQ